MAYKVQYLNPEDRRDVAKCFPIFSILRPKLDEAEFTTRVCVQAEENYKIVYIEMEDKVVAAAGYRLAHFLAWGKVFYIDDLITLPEKKRLGLGGFLMDWLIEQANQLRCDEVHLDTGYQRHDAHRLYLNKGLSLNCHHLARTL
ncbi:MAG: GNAT family N-acetyltransferase [Pseudomonadota bacterium]|nr:GNAT family N-acetyltransferase [Pseudomonadota bacterium]